MSALASWPLNPMDRPILYAWVSFLLLRVPFCFCILVCFPTYMFSFLLMISRWASFRRSMWPLLNFTQTPGRPFKPSVSYVMSSTYLPRLPPFSIITPPTPRSLLSGTRSSVDRVILFLTLSPPPIQISKVDFLKLLSDSRARNSFLLNRSV